MKRRVLRTALVVVVVLSAGCSGLGAPTPSTGEEGDAPDETQTTPVSEPTLNTTTVGGQAGTGGHVALYEQTIDSVVEIRVRTSVGQSQGSGFVYDDGHVVTNQHVVDGAETVYVHFSDGTWASGDVVGTDVYTDLAVVEVESVPAGVEALPVAASDPAPGQQVVALGSPLGYEGSITQGIVSGVNRSMETEDGFTIPDTVQTDASINPGSSGGPLVSTDGTVVGVNRAKQGDNLGFAISADVVRRVVPALIADGEYRHSFVGIRTVQVTPEIAAANDLDAARGVMVVDVLSGGPAGDVLQAGRFTRTDDGVSVPVDGDVIVAIDDRRVRSQQDLSQYLLLDTQPGDQITVTVLRDGERVTETITLGRRSEM